MEKCSKKVPNQTISLKYIFSFSISMLLVLPFTNGLPHTLEVPSRQTLLSALGRALDYMAGNQQQMDINGYLGAAIAQGTILKILIFLNKVLKH